MGGILKKLNPSIAVSHEKKFTCLKQCSRMHRNAGLERRQRQERTGTPATRGTSSSATVLPMAMFVPNLKILTKRLVHDGRKLQLPWGRSPNSAFRGDGERWRLHSQVSHTNSFAPPFWPGTPGA
jgi:hypothetical protein